MIEKDNIQELFSKAFENHASSVRPDLWKGVQAKMSAAGVTSGSAAVKGISALTKWIVGTAAVTTIGVTAYVVTNTDEPQTKQPAPVVTSVNPASEAPNQNREKPANQTIAIVKPSNNTEEEKDQMIVHDFGPKPSIYNRFTNDDIRIVTENTNPYSEPVKTTPNPVVVDNSTNKTTNTAGSGSSVSEGNNEATSTGTNQTEETTAAQVAEAKIELPNIFTPNGDGANEFCEFLKAENVKSVEITIMDQNNNPIFKSNEIGFKWDGTLAGGEQARVGIYTVLITYKDMADKVNMIGKPIYLQR